jgi:hypothetical protein
MKEVPCFSTTSEILDEFKKIKINRENIFRHLSFHEYRHTSMMA